jgi:hypothetical protein
MTAHGKSNVAVTVNKYLCCKLVAPISFEIYPPALVLDRPNCFRMPKRLLLSLSEYV